MELHLLPFSKLIFQDGNFENIASAYGVLCQVERMRMS